MPARRFVDAPNDERCTAVVTLRDDTTADCGRRRTVGDLCTQHAKIAARKAIEAMGANATARAEGR